MADIRIIEELYETIASRRGGDPKSSYTAQLFSKGRATIAKKMGEEAIETIIASTMENPERIASESADLLYHLLVLWADCAIKPEDVWAELARRQGVSGIDEKNSRKNG